uniref:Uncharacterized protein n=1 Tax=Rhizophora mucronata TaxID=61149 RepID=A0A2P2MQZ5_RHIMU
MFSNHDAKKLFSFLFSFYNDRRNQTGKSMNLKSFLIIHIFFTMKRNLQKLYLSDSIPLPQLLPVACYKNIPSPQNESYQISFPCYSCVCCSSSSSSA